MTSPKIPPPFPLSLPLEASADPAQPFVMAPAVGFVLTLEQGVHSFRSLRNLPAEPAWQMWTLEGRQEGIVVWYG